jgi:caa(3)-type oxidase subunit IV
MMMGRLSRQALMTDIFNILIMVGIGGLTALIAAVFLKDFIAYRSTSRKAAAQAHAAGEHAVEHPSEKSYIRIFVLLFILSSSAYFVDLIHFPNAMKWTLLVIIALMKASLIAAFFMHLRYERLGLIYVLVLPLLLLVGLIVAIMPDGVSVLAMRK